MTPLLAEDLIVMRQWIGSESVISNDEVTTLFLQLQDHTKTVLHILRKRLADLTAAPSSLTVPGLSISNSTNIAELRKTIMEVESEGTGLGGEEAGSFKITKLYRASVR